MNKLNTPDGFQQDHSTMMYAADGLAGGDTFFDANTAKDEYKIPDIANDHRLKAITADATSPEDRRKFADGLVQDYGLDTIANRIKEHSANFGDPDRKGVVDREADTADMIMRIGLANARGEAVPAYAERIHVITGNAPRRISSKGPEVTEIRELMKELLARQGYTVTNGKTLEHAVEAWEDKLIKTDSSDARAFQVQLAKAGGDYVKLLQTEVLAKIDPQLGTLPLTGLEYIADTTNPSWDAYLLYIGGQVAKESPLYKGEFKWNVARPAPWEDVKYIAGHESTHYAQHATQDFLRRQGRLGPEAAFITMSSPYAVASEGLAQVGPELVSGGTMEGVIDRFGLAFATMSVQDRLQDLLRFYLAEQVEIEGKEQSTLREVVQTDFLQNRHIAKKYIEKPYWVKNPFGQLYGPAYYEGSIALRAAIAEHGVLPVAETGFGLNGLVDLEAFKAKMARRKITSSHS